MDTTLGGIDVRDLEIPVQRLESVNGVLMNPDLRVMRSFLDTVAKYGTPAEINARAEEARRLPNLLRKVAQTRPEYLQDLEWLMQKRDADEFVPIAEYRRRIMGHEADVMRFADESAVTLEVSALQYFPWIRAVAERALREGSLVPGRFIQVRRMKEQEADGDLPAIAAAMQIIGASYVETPTPRARTARTLTSTGRRP
jgi:hypothetical protein